MKTFTINTIIDSEGFKQVFTSEGVSKLWFGQWYDFNREIVQTNHVEVKEVQAEGFNHALERIKWERQREQYRTEEKHIRTRLNALESKILSKFGKKLKGKANRSKINSFLR